MIWEGATLPKPAEMAMEDHAEGIIMQGQSRRQTKSTFAITTETEDTASVVNE